MLQNKLSDIPSIILLRSDIVLDDLIFAATGSISRSFNSSPNVFSDAVHAFRPNRFRRSDIDAASKVVLKSGYVPDYPLDFAELLFDRYFEFDGSNIISKQVVAEEYSSLVKCIHPFSIIGFRIASLLHKGQIAITDVMAYANHITPLAIARISSVREYAENHLHLGGSNEPHDGIFTLANSQRTPEKFYTDAFLNDLPRLTVFPLVTSRRLSLGVLVDLLQEVSRFLNHCIIFGYGGLGDSIQNLAFIMKGRRRRTLKEQGFTLDFFAKISPAEPTNDVERLFLSLIESYRLGETERSWFLYAVILHFLHLQENVPRGVRLYVKMFFHLTNILRSYMVMSQNLGLSHFKEFFDSSMRKCGSRNLHRNIARNIVMNGSAFLEAKLAPRAVLTGEFINHMAALDAAATDEFSRCTSGRRARARGESRAQDSVVSGIYSDYVPYHFCIHFIREKDPHKQHWRGRLVPPRHVRLRENMEKEARALETILSGRSLKRVSAFQLALKREGMLLSAWHNREALKARILDLTRLFTSLDVAGNEVDAPPEVFAPAIRYLRREVRPLIGNRFGANGEALHHHGRFRLSIHAGEDFAHIATGLRRIDETVRFYGLRQGDRIGHALALGIHPQYWSQRTHEAYLTVEEHLDNLVWLWKRCLEIGQKHTPAIAYAKLCEGELAKFSSKVYGTAYPPQMLYDAWCLRKNCPICYVSRGKTLSCQGDDFYKSVLPSFVGDDKLSEGAVKIFERYHFDRCVRENGGEVFPIRQIGTRSVKEDDRTVTVCDDELEIFEALQDHLITKYSDIGIVIETNPSSNVYIADIDSYSDHPIFRWNPVKSELLCPGGKYNRFGLRKGPIRVCINTDDPSIFLTTLQNEFRLVKEAAAIVFDSCEVEINEWIEKVRTAGVDIFLESHIDPVVNPG